MIGHELERVPRHRQRGDAERQVDPEDQRPVELLGEEAAEHRAADRGHREHRADIALVAAALARRDDVGDDGLRQRHQAAAAEALQRAAEHQGGHRRRQRAGDRAGDEQADRDHHHDAAAVDVGELAVERRHRGAGEQVGRHHPRQFAEIAEMHADGRQRGGDDGLVERAEEHRQHDADDDGADLGVRQRLVLERLVLRGRMRAVRAAVRRRMRGRGVRRMRIVFAVRGRRHQCKMTEYEERAGASAQCRSRPAVARTANGQRLCAVPDRAARPCLQLMTAPNTRM